jgi:extracellular elastinolytic metalloproteinase
MRSAALLSLLGPTVSVLAHPAPHSAQSSDDKLSVLERRAINLESFRLPATAKYVAKAQISTDPAASVARQASYVDVATDLVKRTFPSATFRVVDDHYVGTNGVAHVNFKQTINGIDVDNADFNVNVSR